MFGIAIRWLIALGGLALLLLGCSGLVYLLWMAVQDDPQLSVSFAVRRTVYAACQISLAAVAFNYLRATRTNARK